MKALDGSLWIGGRWRHGRGEAFESRDPATGDVLWTGPAADVADVRESMTAARGALPAWSAGPLSDREQVVRRFAMLLGEERDELADLISRETGKPRWETATEVGAMINKVELSMQAYAARTGTAEGEQAGLRTTVRHRPHGVVAVFGPYNFPGHLPNGHIVPALLAGNTVVFKPSEQTPAVAEAAVRLWSRAGLPDGALNLVQGERATGEALAAHPDLDGLFFTGSARVGFLLHRQFADRPGRILALEMGGNNPLVVGTVEDARAAVHDIVQSAYLSTGQRCTCARRLLLPRGDGGDRLLDALVEAVRRIRVGAWNDDPPPFMGPLISEGAAAQMLQAQSRLLELGAKAILPMRRLGRGPAFLSPGLLDAGGVANLPDEEYFGPLLLVRRYDTLPNAVREANETRYGLSAALLSDLAEDWDYFYAHIRAGIVNRNRQTTGASSAAPFGGVGASGNHRPSAYYAADYCAYPVASVEAEVVRLPDRLAPGLEL